MNLEWKLVAIPLYSNIISSLKPPVFLLISAYELL